MKTLKVEVGITLDYHFIVQHKISDMDRRVPNKWNNLFHSNASNVNLQAHKNPNNQLNSQWIFFSTFFPSFLRVGGHWYLARNSACSSCRSTNAAAKKCRRFFCLNSNPIQKGDQRCYQIMLCCPDHADMKWGAATKDRIVGWITSCASPE